MKLLIACLALALSFSGCVGNLISEAGAARAGQVPAELVGSWRTGRVSLLQYRERTTGSTTPANGSSFSYRIQADGRFEFAGLLQTTMYNCTTSLFNLKRGLVRVEGTRLTLVPQENKWKNEFSCASQRNHEKAGKTDEETYTWRIKEEDGRASLCLTPAGGEESCFRKEEGE